MTVQRVRRRDPGRLEARPGVPAEPFTAGEFALELSRGARALLFVPDLPAMAAAPIAIMLHGAGATAEQMRFTVAEAHKHRCVVLAPTAAGPSWDLIVD